MEWVETTGRSIAAALESALDELGVDEQDAEVVVLEEARAGFLGIGRNDARVRARVRPAAPRPKRPQRGRRERTARSTAGVASATALASRSEGLEAPRGAEATRPPTPRRRGGKGRGSTTSEGPGQRVRTSEEEEQMSVDQQAELAGAFVRGVVERFGLDGTTEVKIGEEQVAVEVTGGDLGLLVGPRGATLDALQELTRTVVQRRGEEHGTRIVVDVAGFRFRRAAALESFTRRIVAEVIASGTPEALEPMSAADRKIVHDVVNGLDGVATSSEGTEPRRYVVIRPASGGGSADGSGTVDEPAADET